MKGHTEARNDVRPAPTEPDAHIEQTPVTRKATTYEAYRSASLL